MNQGLDWGCENCGEINSSDRDWCSNCAYDRDGTIEDEKE
jgi:uncharacterized OB-fold protein